MPKRKSTTAADAAKIKALLLHTNLKQHQIASYLDLNQGRVSEIRQQKRFAHVPPAEIASFYEGVAK